MDDSNGVPDVESLEPWVEFYSEAQLRKWLNETDVGRRILGEEAAALVAGYTPVLVVASADGFLEVYGPHEVRPLVVNRLKVSAAETALLADAYMDSTLPRKWRQWYWPRHLRGGGLVRETTAEDELQRRLDLEWLKGCRVLGAKDG